MILCLQYALPKTWHCTLLTIEPATHHYKTTWYSKMHLCRQIAGCFSSNCFKLIVLDPSFQGFYGEWLTKPRFNWCHFLGATLENLDLEEILNMPANPFTAILPSPNSQDVSNKNTCPASSNIVLVRCTMFSFSPCRHAGFTKHVLHVFVWIRTEEGLLASKFFITIIRTVINLVEKNLGYYWIIGNTRFLGYFQRYNVVLYYTWCHI